MNVRRWSIGGIGMNMTGRFIRKRMDRVKRIVVNAKERRLARGRRKAVARIGHDAGYVGRGRCIVERDDGVWRWLSYGRLATKRQLELAGGSRGGEAVDGWRRWESLVRQNIVAVGRIPGRGYGLCRVSPVE